VRAARAQPLRPSVGLGRAPHKGAYRNLGLLARRVVHGSAVRPKGAGAIGVNESHRKNRQRFSASRWPMSSDTFFCTAEAERRTRSSSTRSRLEARLGVCARNEPRRDEGNQFAGELLVPLEMLHADVESGRYNIENDEDLAQLAERYCVSLQTLMFRLQILAAFGD